MSTSTTNANKANWKIFCDLNSNGEHDDDEQFENVISNICKVSHLNYAYRHLFYSF